MISANLIAASKSARNQIKPGLELDSLNMPDEFKPLIDDRSSKARSRATGKSSTHKTTAGASDMDVQELYSNPSRFKSEYKKSYLISKPADFHDTKKDARAKEVTQPSQDYDHLRISHVEKQIRRLPVEKLTMIGGPFHYQIRAGTFGEVYDEIPWRVMVGLDENKSRDPIDRSLQHVQYNNGVLLNNCYEDRRDRKYIRNHRTPISQYGHMYTTTYGESIGKKRVCNKERAHLQTMKAFPMNAVTAYQPELNVDMLRHCVPKPEECLHPEAKDRYDKEMARQKRYDEAEDPPKEIKYYNTKDLAKCKH